MTITYTHPRTEMLDFLPSGARSVLDVGCSSGAFGQQLRRRFGLEHLVGLEPDHEAANQAAGVYDCVAVGRFPDAQDQLPAGLAYDAIFFNDVLEHMPEPEVALQAARELLAPRGVVIASIPNVRHVSVIGPLVVRGEFKYRRSGILDTTHVRFFTARSIRRLLSEQGWKIERMESINRVLRVGRTETPAWISMVSKLSGGRTDGFFAVQYVVVISA